MIGRTRHKPAAVVKLVLVLVLVMGSAGRQRKTSCSPGFLHVLPLVVQ